MKPVRVDHRKILKVYCTFLLIRIVRLISFSFPFQLQLLLFRLGTERDFSRHFFTANCSDNLRKKPMRLQFTTAPCVYDCRRIQITSYSYPCTSQMVKNHYYYY